MRVCRSHVRAGVCVWVLALPGLAVNAAPLIPLEQFAAVLASQFRIRPSCNRPAALI